MQPRPGIRLVYGEPKQQRKGVVSVMVGFVIGNGVPSRGFVSTKETLLALEKYERFAADLGLHWPATGQQIGHMKLEIRPNIIRGTHVVWTDYGPFYSKFMPVFKRLGLAQMLELRVLSDLKKRYPKIASVRHTGIENARRRQLAKRGSAEGFVPYGLEIERIKTKIRADVAKGRNITLARRP
ncbi:MAG: hypothetical protein V1493_05140 [Candidatus Diapherotrites archaeon]